MIAIAKVSIIMSFFFIKISPPSKQDKKLPHDNFLSCIYANSYIISV
jgi:hypothetical protein